MSTETVKGKTAIFLLDIVLKQFTPFLHFVKKIYFNN